MFAVVTLKEIGIPLLSQIKCNLNPLYQPSLVDLSNLASLSNFEVTKELETK